jgi:two-component system, OmpR family, phosphate regulon sensor histidine kinase PhoR
VLIEVRTAGIGNWDDLVRRWAGIPAADLPRVWERFYSVEKSRVRASGGAGIGLAIVKRLVEEAGGGGAAPDRASTTFWFTLPRA